ncbi:MAG: M23 family metallopeptidase [Candidatus Yonathbacteria bacterium]|nr:M23 family metallopeptidase [Candidatus Yonathbacteria bacterium]
MLCGALSVDAFATTLYRMPLSTGHVPTSWFDHDTRVGYMLRYDGSTNFNYDEHHGTDFASTSGYGIWTGANGTVYQTENTCSDTPDPNCAGGYGNHVRLSHPDGRATIYAPMKKGTVAVAVNQSVLCSALLGNVGNSGDSSGPHLHFELRSSSSSSFTRIDQFGGPYSNGGFSYWVNQNGGNPTTQCQ